MGLRMLLKTGQRIESEDGKLHICCINDTVSSVFGMVGLDTIIPVFETKELALEGLA
jgi:anti-anti-sigma factor